MLSLPLAVACGFALAATPVLAREWNIDGRFINPSRLIDQAQLKGTITTEQADQLRSEERRLADPVVSVGRTAASANAARLAQQANNREVLNFVRRIEGFQSAQAAKSTFSGAPENEYSNSPARSAVTQEKRDDVLITQNIRSRLSGNAALSSRAQNVELSVENRNLTVRGSVASSAERDAVLAIARQYIGREHVFDQLVVDGR